MQSKSGECQTAMYEGLRGLGLRFRKLGLDMEPQQMAAVEHVYREEAINLDDAHWFQILVCYFHYIQVSICFNIRGRHSQVPSGYEGMQQPRVKRSLCKNFLICMLMKTSEY